MKIRRFRADYVFAGDATGIGVTEHLEQWNDETIGIQSIYIDSRLSHRNASVSIFTTVYNSLEKGETALLQMNKFNDAKGWNKLYADKILVKYINKQRGQVYQPTLLSEDALKREFIVREAFDQPVNFSAGKQQKEEEY